MDDSCGVLNCTGKVGYRVFFTNKPEMWVCEEHKKLYKNMLNVREIISLTDVDDTINKLLAEAKTDEERLTQGRLFLWAMAFNPPEIKLRIKSAVKQKKEILDEYCQMVKNAEHSDKAPW